MFDGQRKQAAGWVSVGTDHDTAAFAVESIRRWWTRMGQPTYPNATRLLITADGGGSNGSRCRLWKVELARLALDTGLEITVCHLPPATSKWNKIEHRMFSRISMYWRGRPLTSHEVIIETIKATTTTSGLTIDADLDHAPTPRASRSATQKCERYHSPSTSSTASGTTPSPTSNYDYVIYQQALRQH